MEYDMAISKIKLKIGTVYQKEPNGVYYFRYQVNGAVKQSVLKPAISRKLSRKQKSTFLFCRLHHQKLSPHTFNTPVIWQLRKRICCFRKLGMSTKRVQTGQLLIL